MARFRHFLVPTVLFVMVDLACASPLRSTETSTDNLEGLLQRLNAVEEKTKRLEALEETVRKQGMMISMLEQTIEEHVQRIASMEQTRRLDGDDECKFEYDDGYCTLAADLLVKGRTYLKDGLEVEAGDCDNCIYFADDVIFNDNVKFVDPVVFEDPVFFEQVVKVVGRDIVLESVSSSSSSSSSD